MGGIGRWMVRLAVLWLIMIPVLFVASFVYEYYVPSHDGSLLGMLAAASLVYFFLRPWGLALLVVGLLLRCFAK